MYLFIKTTAKVHWKLITKCPRFVPYGNLALFGVNSGLDLVVNRRNPRLFSKSHRDKIYWKLTFKKKSPNWCLMGTICPFCNGIWDPSTKSSQMIYLFSCNLNSVYPDLRCNALLFFFYYNYYLLNLINCLVSVEISLMYYIMLCLDSFSSST